MIMSRYHLPAGGALLAFALAGCNWSDDGTAAAMAAEPKPAPAIRASVEAPVVVEEFQSQGCSSCPPANANINAIAGRPEVLALSFAVTYWDELGWKDIFASPAFTRRQWDYAHYAGRRQVATPQVIVNGGKTIVGSNRQQLEQLIASEGAPRGGPAIAAQSGTVSVGKGKASKASVWLVRYDPRERLVPIHAGENYGRKLPHRNIVRQLVDLGEWSGDTKAFRLPPPNGTGLASAILVQIADGGPIIAARKL